MGSLEGKKAIVAELVEKFNSSKTIVVVDYRGLTVAQATKLRKQLREAGVDYRVVKNTLLTIAAKEAGAEALVPTFKGVACAFGNFVSSLNCCTISLVCRCNSISVIIKPLDIVVISVVVYIHNC